MKTLFFGLFLLVSLAPAVRAGNPSSRASAPAIYTFTTVAGVPVSIGNVDGTGPAAAFIAPSGTAADGAGNVYVADRAAHTIRKITPAAVVSTLAGLAGVAGMADGTGSAARFNQPTGVAADGAGNVYVADTGNQTIRKITPAGVVSTLAGLAGVAGSADGTGSAARFNQPISVAADSAGTVFVSDKSNHTLRKITPAGVVTTLAGLAGNEGNTDGTGSGARFRVPDAVALDGAGNIYVSSNCTIRKVTPAGVVTTLAGLAGTYDNVDGTGAAARFGIPRALAVDSANNIYAADSYTDTIRKVTPAGVVTTLAGVNKAKGSTDGTGTAARFNAPEGLAIDGGGNLIVGDTASYIIRKISPAGVVGTLAGVGSAGNTDGSGAEAHFFNPVHGTLDPDGNLYIVGWGAHAVRKMTPAGVVTTFAGLADYSGSANGTGSAARFFNPNGITIDSAGNLYIADMDNRQIRKITPAGVVSAWAGAVGVYDHVDGTGAAARFCNVTGVAADGADNVYVVGDFDCTVRKITPAAVVTTLAGKGQQGGYVDATGTAARFSFPQGVATDSAGNIYVADYFNHAIRKVTPAGVVTTLAGNGTAGSADGTGSAARFSGPKDVAVDAAGNVYVADCENNLIRRITPDGVVNTIGGLAGSSGSVDGVGTDARFNHPAGVAVDSTGRTLYVMDAANNTIRRGRLSPPVNGVSLRTSMQYE